MTTRKRTNEEVSNALESHRVPRYVWTQTLESNGYYDLRTYLLSRRFVGAGKTLYIYPTEPAASERATTVALLVAKELNLTWCNTMVLAPMDLIRMYDNTLSTWVQERIEAAGAFLVRDFFCDWDAAPKNPLGDNLFKAEYILKGLIEAEAPVFFHAEHPLASATKWWSQSMVQRLVASCGLYPIDKA